MRNTMSTRHLFARMDKERLNWTKHRSKFSNPQEMCKEIFDKMLELILLEVIENNSIFALPKFYGKDAEIYIDTVTGDELKERMQKGEFADIDIIKSNFKAHCVKFAKELKGGRVTSYPLFIKNEKLQQLLTDNTNNGNVYY